MNGKSWAAYVCTTAARNEKEKELKRSRITRSSWERSSRRRRGKLERKCDAGRHCWCSDGNGVDWVEVPSTKPPFLLAFPLKGLFILFRYARQTACVKDLSVCWMWQAAHSPILIPNPNPDSNPKLPCNEIHENLKPTKRRGKQQRGSWY